MADAAQEGRREMLSNALEHLKEGLRLLDEAEAPSQLGARIDQTIHELYMVIADMTAGSSLVQMDRNAEPQ